MEISILLLHASFDVCAIWSILMIAFHSHATFTNTKFAIQVTLHTDLEWIRFEKTYFGCKCFSHIHGITTYFRIYFLFQPNIKWVCTFCFSNFPKRVSLYPRINKASLVSPLFSSVYCCLDLALMLLLFISHSNKVWNSFCDIQTESQNWLFGGLSNISFD